MSRIAFAVVAGALLSVAGSGCQQKGATTSADEPRTRFTGFAGDGKGETVEITLFTRAPDAFTGRDAGLHGLDDDEIKQWILDDSYFDKIVVKLVPDEELTPMDVAQAKAHVARICGELDPQLRDRITISVSGE